MSDPLPGNRDTARKKFHPNPHPQRVYMLLRDIYKRWFGDFPPAKRIQNKVKRTVGSEKQI